MAEMTQEQNEMAEKEMRELIFKETITIAEARKLPKYPGSDKCEFDKIYFFTEAMAIMRTGQTTFKMFDVR